MCDIFAALKNAVNHLEAEGCEWQPLVYMFSLLIICRQEEKLFMYSS